MKLFEENDPRKEESKRDVGLAKGGITPDRSLGIETDAEPKKPLNDFFPYMLVVT